MTIHKDPSKRVSHTISLKEQPEGEGKELSELAKESERDMELKETERLRIEMLKQMADRLRSGEPIPNVPFRYFKAIFKEYRYLMKSRIGMHLRIASAKKMGRTDWFLLLPSLKYLTIAERQLENFVRRIVCGHPLWEEFGQHVGSFSPVSLAWFIYYMRVEKAEYPASFIKYCGFAVDEWGWGERLRKGEKAQFNPELKGRCHVVGVMFLKLKHPKYYPIYVEAKKFYKEKFPKEEIFDGKRMYYPQHIHLMALRKVIRAFLIDLYVAWRKVAHLQINPEYIQALYDYKRSHFNEPIPDVFDPVTERKIRPIADPISREVGDKAIRDLEDGDRAKEDIVLDAKPAGRRVRRKTTT